jgi:hypothetical protein
MDFEEDLGELVDEALGRSGVEIDDVIRALQVKLSAVKELKRDGAGAGTLGADDSFAADDEHDERDWE